MGEMMLAWESHNETMSTKLWEFFNEEYLVDFSVTCHGQQMKVHKFVLALMFPILKESLQSCTGGGSFVFDRENEPTTSGRSTAPVAQGLNLDNVAEHAEDMVYLIQFAYTGKTTVPNEHADCLMRIADNMKIPTLKESIERWRNNKQSEQTDVTLGRLRPRSQLKKIVAADDHSDSDPSFERAVFGRRSTAKDTRLGKLLGRVANNNGTKGKVQTRKNPTTKRNEPSRSPEGKDTEETSKDKEEDTDGVVSTVTVDSSECSNQTEQDEDQARPISHPETTNPSQEPPESNRRNLKCPHCDYVTSKAHDLKCHLRTHYERLTMRFTCKTCRKMFATKDMYMLHLDSKCGECKYCSYRTTRKRNLLNHIMAKHQVDGEGNPLERNLKCQDCDFVCFAKHQLRCHSLAKHERIDTFKCNECSYTAPYRNPLLKHIRIMHQHRRDYMCDECGSQFQTSGSLNRHVLNKHKGVKPYKCDVCDAKYSHNFNLKLHRQKHTGEASRNHVCHVCGQGFFRRDHLRVHCRSKHKVELASAKPTYEFLKSTASETTRLDDDDTEKVVVEIETELDTLITCQ